MEKKSAGTRCMVTVATVMPFVSRDNEVSERDCSINLWLQEERGHLSVKKSLTMGPECGDTVNATYKDTNRKG